MSVLYDQPRNGHPVSKWQVMVGASTRSAQPVPATAPLPQRRFLLGQPGRRQFPDQLAQAPPGDTGADTMRQGRAGPS
jgi:hypothetical protein